MAEWIEANLQVVNTSKLRAEFLEKEGVPQTSTEGSHIIEIEDEATKAEADVHEVASQAIDPFIPLPPPPI